jgi:membrane fusion protein, multidrug efflux system
MKRTLVLMNTPLQRGARALIGQFNRFSGFNEWRSSRSARETAEAVHLSSVPPFTPLKRGVNEKRSGGTRDWQAWPLLLLGMALFAGCGHKSEPRSSFAPNLPTVAVHTQTVESKQWPSTEEVVGTVRAKLRATLEAKVSGRIAEMPVVLGQQVKGGQLLARLDAAEVKARLDQAQANLQQAEREWKRVSALFGQQAITRSELDAAESHHLVAKAGVAEAEAMMTYAEVHAPFDGVVTRKWADVGDLASPGKPLVDLEDPSALQLEADVPEAIVSHVQLGAQMALRVDTLPTNLSGTVSELAPAADPLSRTFRVKLDLPAVPTQPVASDTRHSTLDTPHFLRSGQFARLLVPVGESASLRVPAAAVVQRGQMELVFVVKDQRAQLHLVKTGRHIGPDAEILSGLDAGDAVVVSGATQLLDGQSVEAK